MEQFIFSCFLFFILCRKSISSFSGVYGVYVFSLHFCDPNYAYVEALPVVLKELFWPFFLMYFLWKPTTQQTPNISNSKVWKPHFISLLSVAEALEALLISRDSMRNRNIAKHSTVFGQLATRHNLQPALHAVGANVVINCDFNVNTCKHLWPTENASHKFVAHK